MKKYLFLGASYILPAIALAHGNGDGHDQAMPDMPQTGAAAVDERKKVALWLGVGVVVVVALLWYIKKKNAVPPAP